MGCFVFESQKQTFETDFYCPGCWKVGSNRLTNQFRPIQTFDSGGTMLILPWPWNSQPALYPVLFYILYIYCSKECNIENKKIFSQGFPINYDTSFLLCLCTSSCMLKSSLIDQICSMGINVPKEISFQTPFTHLPSF